MDVETVSEGQRRTLLDVGLDLVGVQLRLMFIGRQYHHDIGGSDRILYGSDLESC